MKRKTNFKHFLAMLLAVTMIVSVMAPMSALAIDIDESKLGDDTFLTSRTDYTVAPGIKETHMTTNNSTGSNQVKGYSLEVDLSNSTTSIISSYRNYDASSWGMQTVRDQVAAVEAKRGVNVVAGVNGDGFNMSTGEPTGTLVMNGKTVHVNDKWCYFAIKNDNTPIIGSGALDTSDIKECIGGLKVIVKNGKITKDAQKDQVLHPRTTVGIKADGKVVIYVCDGRQAPMSCGMTLTELANIMISLGCVDALNLDGGGSTTFLSQHEGSDELVCRNSPSDGSERTVSTALLICSSAKPNGVFDHASLTPNNEIYTPGYEVELGAMGVDSAGGVAELPADGTYALVDDSFGTIEGNVFTSNGKIGTVEVNYVSGGEVVGSTSFEIRTPDSISFTNEEISLGFEKQSTLGLQVKYKTIDVNYKVGDIVWTMDDEKMGSFEGNTFTSSDCESITGNIYATSAYDASVSGSITAIIGKLPSVVWDFENPEDYVFAHAACDPGGGKVTKYSSDYVEGVTTMLNINYDRKCVVDSTIVDADTGKVRMGNYALRIDCNFTKVGSVTEGACIGGVNATESADGTPTAVGLWMYAPEGTPNYWVRMRFEDGNGTVQTVSFNESGANAGIDWVGWKYLEADISGFQGPFKFFAGETVRLMQLNKSNGFYTYTGVDEEGNKTFKSLSKANRKGYVYIDNVQFVYGANTDDTENPVIDSIEVGNSVGDNMTNIGASTVVNSNDVCIQSTFHDIQNKYTTDINFDACRVYVDGKDVTDKAIVLSGDSMIKYYTTLANGMHSVQFVIRDNFNNETFDTRYFTVDGNDDLPTVKVEPASESCVLNSDLYVDIASNRADVLNSTKAQIRFDTDIVKSADDFSVTFAPGFDGTYTYNKTTGVVDLTVNKTAAIVASGEFDTLAKICVKIPANVAEGKAFVYRVLQGSIDFSDASIVTDTFASADISVPVTATYKVYTDTIMVNNPGIVYVENADGTPAAYVDVYNSADELIGTTGENGTFEYEGFSNKVQSYSIYAMKDGKYSFVFSSQSYATAGNTDGTPSDIIINASSNGDTSKSIVWLSEPLVAADVAAVQYATKAAYEADGEAAFTSVTGDTELFTFAGSSSVSGNYTVRINGVTLTGLKQNTEYVYRAGDGVIWSDVKNFKTSMTGTNTNFFVFGDIQAEDTTNVANLLKAVANDGIAYDFGIQTGDSVENASLYSCWNDILSVYADENIADTALIHVLGNHEYMGDTYADAANSLYALPNGNYYSVTYGNTYVAVINYMNNTKEEQAAAIEWLRNDAANSSATWKFLTIHTPVYNTNILDSHPFLMENLTAAAEEAGIDLVFSGHDHSYSRTKPMTAGNVDVENGITYFICGSSGEKSYGVTINPEYNFDIATNDYTSIYISVSTTDSTCTVNAYDVSGNNSILFDSYVKTKTYDCTVSGHNYSLADGYLTCKACGYVAAVGSYTGLVSDAATDKAMYLIGGSPVTGWFVLGEDNYYFDENGIAITGEVKLDGHTYTFGEDGKMILGAFEKNSDGTYSYYINGEKQRGWFFINGYWYYFSRTNGFKTLKGEVQVNSMKYTFDNEGRLVKGAWNITDTGTSYYWGPDPVTGLQEIDGETYYFNPVNAYMCTDSVEINGVVYAFNMDGTFAHYGAHNDRTYVKTVAATCTDDGYILYTCKDENGNVRNDYMTLKAEGHADTNKDYICDKCGKATGNSLIDFLRYIFSKFYQLLNKILGLFN